MLKLITRIKKFGIDLLKIKSPKNLSVLSVESIIKYVDPSKRLFLSLKYPHFRKIEKRIRLELRYINICSTLIKFEEKYLKFHNGQIAFFESKDFVRGRKALRKFNGLSSNSEKAILKVITVLFAGRLNFRVKYFESEIELPVNLNMDVSRVYLPGLHQVAPMRLGNIFRKVDCVMLCILQSPDDIRQSWIQNSERLEILNGEHAPLIVELPNLRAKTIHIKLDSNLMDCLELIRTWIENRKTEDGAALYIDFFYVAGAYRIFYLNQLHEMGFAKIDDNRRRLSLENSLEARLTVRTDEEHFYELEWGDPQFEYLSIEIVNSEHPY